MKSLPVGGESSDTLLPDSSWTVQVADELVAIAANSVDEESVVEVPIATGWVLVSASTRSEPTPTTLTQPYPHPPNASRMLTSPAIRKPLGAFVASAMRGVLSIRSGDALDVPLGQYAGLQGTHRGFPLSA